MMKPKSSSYRPKSSSVPFKARPEILTHPNIPQPLHGMAPRVIKGRAWWDKTRKAAYEKHQYRCWACGKSSVTPEMWNSRALEAHENYKIDYAKGEMVVTEITALCSCCHSFIHSGRLDALLVEGKIEPAKAIYILERGFKLLKAAGLKPFYGTAMIYAEHFAKGFMDSALRLQEDQGVGEIQQDWSEWHLILDGEKHYSKFKNFKEWKDHYDK
ncbi:hypothetical protein N9937_00890 [bacterium]|nr:hypothetical protein [bacterium]